MTHQGRTTAMLLAGALLAGLAHGQPVFSLATVTKPVQSRTTSHSPLTPLRVSQAALLAATLADALSSRGLTERNPVLGRGDFTMKRQGALALGITAGVVVGESALVRKWPGLGKWLAWSNWIGVGGHAAASAHNWRIER